MKAEFVYTQNGKIKLWIDEHQIIHSVVSENAKLDIDDVVEAVKLRKQLQAGVKMSLLIDVRYIKTVTLEARHYLSQQVVKDDFYGVALYFKNTISKMVASMALGFNRPEVVTQTFSDYEKAISWLIKNKVESINS